MFLVMSWVRCGNNLTRVVEIVIVCCADVCFGIPARDHIILAAKYRRQNPRMRLSVEALASLGKFALPEDSFRQFVRA